MELSRFIFLQNYGKDLLSALSYCYKPIRGVRFVKYNPLRTDEHTHKLKKHTVNLQPKVISPPHQPDGMQVHLDINSSKFNRAYSHS